MIMNGCLDTTYYIVQQVGVLIITYAIMLHGRIILYSIMQYMGIAVAQWLRYCATNRKVAGSIPLFYIESSAW